MREKINLHLKGLEILEAIKALQKRNESSIENINGFPGTFPRLKKKYENDIDTRNRCIERLLIRHNIVVSKLYKSGKLS